MTSQQLRLHVFLTILFIAYFAIKMIHTVSQIDYYFTDLCYVCMSASFFFSLNIMAYSKVLMSLFCVVAEKV